MAQRSDVTIRALSQSPPARNPELYGHTSTPHNCKPVMHIHACYTWLTHTLASTVQHVLQRTCHMLGSYLAVFHCIATWTMHCALPICLAHTWTIATVDYTARLILGIIITNALMQHAPIITLASIGWQLTQAVCMIHGMQLTIVAMVTMGHLIIPTVILSIATQHTRRHPRRKHRTPHWSLTGQNPMHHGLEADLGGIHSINASLTRLCRKTPARQMSKSWQCIQHITGQHHNINGKDIKNLLTDLKHMYTHLQQRTPAWPVVMTHGACMIILGITHAHTGKKNGERLSASVKETARPSPGRHPLPPVPGPG